jgi:hypothetical protein
MGEVSHGEMHGRGELVRPNGERVVGLFANNATNGPVEHYYPHGDVYRGQEINGKPNGYGSTTAYDGSKRVSEYKDGMNPLISSVSMNKAGKPSFLGFKQQANAEECYKALQGRPGADCSSADAVLLPSSPSGSRFTNHLQSLWVQRSSLRHSKPQ